MPSPQSSVYTTGSPLVALPPVPAPSFREKAQKFFTKHGNDPLGYTAKWITEFFEFGSSVIDKQSLSARYVALEKWGDMGDQAGLASAANNPEIGGDWIHFFTVAMKRERDESGRLINESPGHSPPPSIFYPDRQGSSGNAPAMVGEIPVEIAPFKPKDQPSTVDPSLSTTTTTASIPSPASTTTSPADAQPPAYAPSDSASGSGLEFEQFKKSARDEKALFHARRAEKAARRAAAAESSSSHGGFSLSRMLGRKKSDLGSNQPAPSAVQQPAAASDNDLLSPTSINPEGGPTMNPRASLSNTSLSSFASRESSLDVPAPGGSLSRPTSPTGSTHSGAPSSQGRRKKQGRPHHFIVLPWAMPYRWKGIYIEGVDDEVAAHTGIFFPNMNFEYDSLVEKAGNFVMEAVRYVLRESIHARKLTNGFDHMNRKRQVAFGIQPA
ncbi:hypothetical protein DL93DRAFT_2084857 [Clavulina sp. PMI_390]|nr:hypothetical protein DL93DRAFT_2084857 [Clavulina sp. PMI_390]